MDVSFKNEYIVEVFFFVLLIYFCKNVLQCVDAALSVFQKLSCDCPVCYGMTCLEISRSALITFSAIQPVILCIIVPIHVSLAQTPINSNIFTVSLNFNTSMAALLHDSSHLENIQANYTVEWFKYMNVTEIDLRIFVVPFSVAASASTASWLFLCREGVFNSDPTWDNSLFETESMWTYEIIHYVEIFFMTLALIVTATQPQTLDSSFYMTSTLTALYIFFATTSKFSEFSVVGQFLNSAAFAFMGSILVTFLSNGIEVSCSLAIAAGWLLAIGFVMMTVLYQTANGALTAGAIITVRTLAANVVTLVFCVVLFNGRTTLCAL